MKLLAAIALLAVPYFSPNPTYVINWGEQSKAGGRSASYMPLGWHANEFYTLQMEKKEGRLIKLDDKTNITSQQELVTGQKKFEADLVYLRDGKIYMLSSEFESKQKANFVRATTFTLDGKPGDIKWKTISFSHFIHLFPGKC